MAVTADKVVVELELKDGQYLAKVKQAERQFVQSQEKIAGAAKNTERQIRASSAAIASSLRNMAGAIAAGASVGAIKSMADSYTQMGNRLRVVGHEAGAASDQFDKLMQVATDSRSDIESVVQVYSRLSMAADGMGLSASQVTRVTEILTKSLKASGATAQETSAALLQFGQGIGAGALMGDELRSIRENAPIVARAIADEFGTTIGGLKKLGEEGKLTSDRVLKAVLASGQQVDALWANTVATVSDAFSNLRNQLIKYIGEADQAGGYSERLSKALGLLADNIDKVVPALGTIATLFTAKWVGGMVAASVATDGFARKAWEAASAAMAAEKAKTQALAVETRTRTMLLNAEVVALQRQVATGRNAQGQFISMAAAQAALSARTRELAASMPAATAATIRNTTAMQGAMVAARGLGSGLVALAGGPVGVAILAIAGLVYGLSKLHESLNGLSPAQKALNSRYEEAKKASEDYKKALDKVAVAQGEAKKTAIEEANALRALTLKRIEDTKAAIKQAEASLAVAKANADSYRQGQEILNSVPSRGDAGMSGALGGAGYVQGNFDARVQREIKNIEEQSAALKQLQEDVENFSSSLGGLGGGNVEDSGGNASKKDKDRRKEVLADLLEQSKIEEAQLRGQNILVRQLEREAEIRGRIKSLVDAGYSQAQAESISSEIQKRLDDAKNEADYKAGEALAEEINLQAAKIAGQIEIVRLAEQEAELKELIAKYEGISASSAEAKERAEADQTKLMEARAMAAEKFVEEQQRSSELRIAEIMGDRKRVQLLSDQEEIVRRTNELRAQGWLSEEEARRRATSQVTAERAATDYAAQRDMFASTFSEGIRAAMAGDLQGFLSSQFGNLADMAFKKLGEMLFESISSAPVDMARAQAEGAIQGATIATSMTAAGSVAALEIGGAITTAGAAAAAQIAAAMSAGGVGPLAFMGFRAKGGPVRAGGAYTVGENGRETFVPAQNGYIIPNMENMRVGGAQPSVVKLIVDEGSMFALRVQQISGPIAVQAASASAAYSQDTMRTQRRRQSQSFA